MYAMCICTLHVHEQREGVREGEEEEEEKGERAPKLVELFTSAMHSRLRQCGL